jgi:hypothetical protein
MRYIKFALIVGLIALILISCEKDEARAILQPGVPPVLSASQSDLVLEEGDSAAVAQVFSWNAADFGFAAGVTYTLEIAPAGTNFATPTAIDLGTARTFEYTVAGLNQLALLAGLTAGTAGQLEARVRAEISDRLDPVYSNTVSFGVTPYEVVITYPALWVPGDHQGWSPATAARVVSIGANGEYEGYEYVGGGNLKFKFTSAPDWDHINYGWASSMVMGTAVTGTMSPTGGDLFVPTPGYYRMRANTNDLTWEVVRTEWGLIGDAIPVTGWNTDVDMAFDPATETWEITLDLVPGKIKFRANDDWAINYGDDGGDLRLEHEGADIPIAEAGNYTVVLDLSAPEKYTYTITKN